MTNQRRGPNVLICHPFFGRLWLSDCEWTEDAVIGEVWDDSDAGSPYMPDDYRGQPDTMNFPLTCVLRVVTP